MSFSRNILIVLALSFLCFTVPDAKAQIISGGYGQGVAIGGPYGIQYGGGQGYRIGPPRFGVQYGGGQGVRYGTPRFGVQYGGGQGVRFGAPNAGRMCRHILRTF
jgi:hypothetical protein